MKDLLGRELAVGDYVAYQVKNYRELDIAQIVGISAKMVKLQVRETTAWNKGTFSQPGSATLKVDGPEVTLYFLKKDAKQQ